MTAFFRLSSHILPHHRISLVVIGIPTCPGVAAFGAFLHSVNTACQTSLLHGYNVSRAI
ncbi:hypothetical protein BDR05DRAFT_970479 [Suillus weaverae]|nr:hypothetical protein BDR05DRAFT_970479 [Suillus weaverae]